MCFLGDYVFGYVNIYKDELKVKDYNIYRSYYCGLCKKLGEEFSIRARLSLNYDFAFLALVLSSLSDGKEEIKYENCFIHPLTKRPVLKSDDYLTYSAYMSIIVTYFKLKDDVSDNKNIKSFFAYLFFKGYFKKAKKKYPKKCEIIKTILEELNIKEKENCADIDEVSDCFGRLLSEVFLKDGEDRALKEFSYQLGRFIYIIDALDDIEKDIKSEIIHAIHANVMTGGKTIYAKVYFTDMGIIFAAFEKKKLLLDRIYFKDMAKVVTDGAVSLEIQMKNSSVFRLLSAGVGDVMPLLKKHSAYIQNDL